jgi:hypothetical protein
MVQMKLSLCIIQDHVIEVYGGLVTRYIIISVLFEYAENCWYYTASVTEE